MLDNCEHLLDACAALADALLRACPGVRILATSREPLGIAGETAWRVPVAGAARPASALPPRPSAGRSTRRCGCSSSGRGRRSPRFALTERERRRRWPQVCRRLDGIPLALELAAARVTALPVEQIAARLDDRFRLLTGGQPHGAAAPADAAGDARLELRPADRAGAGAAAPAGGLRRRLDAGGGRGGRAPATASSRADGARPADAAGRQVAGGGRASAGGEARYRLLETVRQYARGAAARRPARRRPCATGTAAWFLALAERAEPALWSARTRLAWLAGWRPSTTTCGRRSNGADWHRAGRSFGGGRHPRHGAYPVAVLADAGASDEARRSLIELLARAPAPRPHGPTPSGAAGIWRSCRLTCLRRTFLEEGLSLSRELGHAFGTIMTLGSLGAVATVQGDLERAARCLKRVSAPIG